MSRPLVITTPLGPGTFLVTGLVGQEGLSQLFHFHADLLVENGKDVPFDQLLGQKACAQLELPGGKKRFFHGICSRFGQGGSNERYTNYRMELVPQFWLLTRKAQSRIFQHLAVPDILKQVLAGVDVSFELQGDFAPRDFCVQYRETDFNFASRLMEEEGIYYFFKHSAGGHKMVLANTPDSHPDLPEKSQVVYTLSERVQLNEGRVSSWEKVQELRSGKYTLWDHCFELPHKHLEAEKAIQESVAAGQTTLKLKVGGNDRMELYDWPGEYAQRFDGVDRGGGDQAGDLQKIFKDNQRTVGIRMQQEAVPGLVVQGSGDCGQFVAGHKFTLTTIGDDRLGKLLKAEGPYVLTGVSHTVTAPEAAGPAPLYSNHFTCIPLALPFRPPRVTPRPFVQGPQTAVVVGPPGEEIFTDKYGRVKVQFHWDREGKSNADSSCWVRVSQVWAGKRWGASFWPRVGQEVVVAFLEGDPDQPIIIGSVYNADQMPPYLGDGPDGKHAKDNKVSGVKSNTTLGGVGFNEWRFDDTKGKEEIFLHAERNLDTRVKHDSTERVIHDRHLIVGWEKDGDKGGDQREMVYQDKHLNVKRDQVEQIEGNHQLTIGKGEAKDGGNVDIVIEKDKKELIGKDDHLHVKGKQAALVDGAQDLTVGGEKKELVKGKSHVHVQADRCENVDGGQSLTVGGDQQEKVGKKHAVDAGQEIHLKAGMKVIIEAGVQVTLKGPGGFVDIGPAGVTIQGTMVLINSGGAAGSGSGSSPTAPQDAKPPQDAKEAKPTKPAMADDSKTGAKSAPK